MTTPPRARRARQGRRPRNSSSTTDAVTTYARAVDRGALVAGPLVRGACRRHLEDLERTDLVWDTGAVDRVLQFFPSVLRLAGGDFEGRQFDLEPWQAFVVGSLFGWRRPNGQRRFRTAYVETAKGSGKSPLAAGVGHYMLVADGEARAEVYAAATKKEQAMVLFRDAVAMFQQSPQLRSRMVPSGSNPIWQLTYLAKASFFKAISNDDGQSGPRPYCALVDEVHEHKDASTIDMLEAGFKFRRNPLLFLITNSGSDATSVCWSYHDLAARVMAGETHDDEFFAYVCSLDDGDDPFEDEACWIKANPSLGVTIKPDYLRSRVERARNLPDKRNEVLRLNFCVWTDAEAAWMTKPVWMACQRRFSIEDVKGRKAWIGCDLAIRNDLCAVAIVVEDGFDEQGRPRFLSWVEFWLPAEKLAAKEVQDGQPYRRWAEEGHLRLSEGNFVRQEFIAARLVEIAQVLDVQVVAYDEYAVKWLEIELDDLGAALPLLEHPQGFRRGKRPDALPTGTGEPVTPGLWMPESIAKTEELIIETLIGIAPNPILTWNVASTTFERDPQGNRKLSKRKTVGRIDGTVALVMACGAAQMRQTLPNRSYLETSELVIM
jgi:phage terminase large subunit-like protein